MIEIPRESIEFVAIAVTLDGYPTTENIDISITTGKTARPTVWSPAMSLDDRVGFLTGPYPPGEHTAWARISSNPEKPVVNCGPFRIT